MADRLFQGIADRIVAMIDEGEFAPGSRLPGERELAEMFGVSRVTIREAEIPLQAVGRIKIKTGSGVYVADAPVEADVLPQVSAFELTDARARSQEHASIVEALRRRNPQGARVAMREHFHRLLGAMLYESGEREITGLRRQSAESHERFLMSAQIG